MSRRLLFAIVVFVVTATGCGGDSPSTPSPTPNTPSPTPNTSGVRSALIDGVQWTARDPIAATYQNNILGVTGVTADGSILLGFGVGTGASLITSTPQTYTFGQPQSHNAIMSITVNGVVQGGWGAGVGQGSGSVTIANLSTTAASGTFAFTMIPKFGSGAVANKVVTQGVFNVRF